MQKETLSGALIVGVVLLFAGAYFIPWQNVNWGTVTMSPTRTITVSGEATKQETNQLASFTAGVDAVNANKETAISEVNQKMQALTDALKTFGIAEADIQTQNMSVYQEQESYYADDGAQRSRPGQWRVNNSVEITVRDVAQVTAMNELLVKSGATNVYGPNYRTDDTQKGDDLLNEAVKNARLKAEALAESQGAVLGSVLQVVESGSIAPMPMYRDMGMGGGGAESFPGSTTLSKSVSVTFEIK
jgi:hypothetical protein